MFTTATTALLSQWHFTILPFQYFPHTPTANMIGINSLEEIRSSCDVPSQFHCNTMGPNELHISTILRHLFQSQSWATHSLSSWIPHSLSLCRAVAYRGLLLRLHSGRSVSFRLRRRQRFNYTPNKCTPKVDYHGCMLQIAKQ